MATKPTDVGLYVRMGAGKDATNGPNTAFVDLSSPDPAKWLATPANVQFSKSGSATTPAVTSASGAVTLTYPSSAVGVSSIVITNPTVASGLAIQFDENRLPASGGPRIFRSVQVTATPLQTNYGATSGYPVQYHHTWYRTTRVWVNETLSAAGPELDSVSTSAFTNLISSGILIEDKWDFTPAFPNDYSKALRHTRLTYQQFSWGRELVREERLATDEDVALAASTATSFIPTAANAGNLTPSAQDLIQAQATAYDYHASALSSELAKQGLLKSSRSFHSLANPAAPAPSDWVLHDWSFSNYDARGRLSQTTRRNKSGNLTLGTDGLPTQACRDANEVLNISTGNSTGNIFYSVSESVSRQNFPQLNKNYTITANFAGGSVAVTNNADGVTVTKTSGATANGLPDRTTVHSYTWRASQTTTLDHQGGRSVVTDNAAGTVTSRYHTTAAPLSLVEVKTLGSNPLLISKTHYFYHGRDSDEDDSYETRVVHSHGQVEYTHTEYGRVTRRDQSGAASQTYTYDRRGRMVSQTETESAGLATSGDSLGTVQRTWTYQFTDPSPTGNGVENVSARFLSPETTPRHLSVSASVGGLQVAQDHHFRTQISYSWRPNANELISDNLDGPLAAWGQHYRHNRSKAFADGTEKSSWARVGSANAFVPVALTSYTSNSVKVARCGVNDTEASSPTEWTTRYFDSQGRVYAISQPGDAAQNPLRDASWQTFSYDGVGRQWRSQINGEGAQIRVFDPVSGEVSAEGIDADQSGSLDVEGFAGWDRVKQYARTWVADPANPGWALRRTSVEGLVIDYSESDPILSTTDVALGGGKHRVKTTTPEGTAEQVSPATFDAATWTQIPTNLPYVPETVVSISTNTSGGRSVSTTRLGRLIASQSEGNEAPVGSLLQRTRYQYDALGRISASHDSRTGTTSYSYSPDELTTTVTAPATPITAPDVATPVYVTPVTLTVMDVMGQTVSVNRTHAGNGALAQITTWTYSAAGQVEQERGATYPVNYAYDRQGRMVSMTTFKEHAPPAEPTKPEVTLWAYNNIGLLETKTTPGFDQDGNGSVEPAGVVRYAYTNSGRIARRTWARGVSVDYHYHPATGDLVYTDYANNTDIRDLSYTYDRLGRIKKVEEGTMNNPPQYTVGVIHDVPGTNNHG